MNDEFYDKLKAEMRLQALENIVCILAGFVLKTADKFSPGIFDEFGAVIRASAGKVTAPNLDPAMSDLAAGELQERIERLLELIEQQRKN